MKSLFTLALALICPLVWGQNPNWDPDANGDNLIGSSDLQSLLSVYGLTLGVDTTQECDFEGEPKDEWLFGILSGAIVVDSVVVQFHVIDSTNYYEPGCPVQKTAYLNVEWEYTMHPYEITETQVGLISNETPPWGLGGGASIRFDFDGSEGTGYIGMDDFYIARLSSSAPFSTNFSLSTYFVGYSCINVEEDVSAFELDENGIVAGFNCAGEPEGETPWNDPAFQYYRVLPFWHYTE